MASVAKFKINEAPRLLAHCSRTQKNHGSHIHDYRTELNFNLAKDLHNDESDYEFVKNKIKQPDVKMMKRDDVKVVCDWAVTMPRELCHEVVDHNGEEYYVPNDDEECKEFFQHAYDFLKAKHGEENIISANVHMDENVPHMHFAFVPIVRDKKDKHLKVCAKEALSDCYGAKFQIELQDYISAQMGKELHMVRQDTVDYERNVKELKKKTLNAKCAALTKQIAKEEEILERKKRVLNAMSKAMDAETVDIRTSSSNGLTVIKTEDWGKIQEQLRFINAMKKERQEVLKMIKDFESDNNASKAADYQEQAERLMKENEKMEKEIQNLTRFIEREGMNESYKKFSEQREHFEKQILNIERGERSR